MKRWQRYRRTNETELPFSVIFSRLHTQKKAEICPFVQVMIDAKRKKTSR